MNKKTNIEVERARKSGLRPVVVACILNKGKVLFLFQRKFQLWQLPQGGIEIGETLEGALYREVAEELGYFSRSLKPQSVQLIGDDSVEFPKESQGKREVIDSMGDKHFMVGKKYFFMLVQSRKKILDIEKTEFEKYRWVELGEVKKLTSQIYQKGKRRVTEKAIELIKKELN